MGGIWVCLFWVLCFILFCLLLVFQFQFSCSKLFRFSFLMFAPFYLSMGSHCLHIFQVLQQKLCNHGGQGLLHIPSVWKLSYNCTEWGFVS